jgi:twitching motility protein PilT
LRLNAAETGHLVLSTLHTVDAGQTINRIFGMFPNGRGEPGPYPTGGYRAVGCLSTPAAQNRGRARGHLSKSWVRNLRVKSMPSCKGESEGKTFYEIIQAGHGPSV